MNCRKNKVLLESRQPESYLKLLMASTYGKNLRIQCCLVGGQAQVGTRNCHRIRLALSPVIANLGTTDGKCPLKLPLV